MKLVKKKKGLILVIVLMSVMVACSGNTAAPKLGVGQDYYIDGDNGDDNNSGTSENSPWKTLDKVSSITFQPGDNIYFKRGSIYEGSVTINGDGTASNPITISAYGTGNAPSFSNPRYVNNRGNAMRIRGDYHIVENLYFHHCAPAIGGDVSFEQIWSVGALHVSLGNDHVIIRNNEFANNPKAIQSYSQHSLITNINRVVGYLNRFGDQ
jgi:predicted small secreted protein